jgi:hypothetical protein
LIHIKGGKSLSNKSKRFSDKVEDIPGPGAYTIEEKTEPSRAVSVHDLKISKQRVKFNRKKNPPSIQDPKQAFGFEEATNGELVPQIPPEKDATLGPAYYNTVIAGLIS